MSTRRDAVRPIIARVIAEHGTGDMPLLREKLREAFPWGERKYHPYKIWLDEIAYQLGTKKAKAFKEERDPNQAELF